MPTVMEDFKAHIAALASAVDAVALERAGAIRELREVAKQINNDAWRIECVDGEYARILEALRGAAIDPRAATIDEIIRELQLLNDQHAGHSKVLDFPALVKAHDALGPQGYVFVHLIIGWLSTMKYTAQHEAGRMTNDGAALANLERDDARRGWAIAKAGSADDQALRASARALFGDEEAERLFPFASPPAPERT